MSHERRFHYGVKALNQHEPDRLGESPPVPSNETMDEILKIEDGVESVLSKGDRSPSSSFMTRMPPVKNHVGIRRK